MYNGNYNYLYVLEILRQHEEHMRIAEDLRRQLDNDMYYRDGGGDRGDRGDRLALNFLLSDILYSI